MACGSNQSKSLISARDWPGQSEGLSDSWKRAQPVRVGLRNKRLTSPYPQSLIPEGFTPRMGRMETPMHVCESSDPERLDHRLRLAGRVQSVCRIIGLDYNRKCTPCSHPTKRGSARVQSPTGVQRRQRAPCGWIGSAQGPIKRPGSCLRHGRVVCGDVARDRLLVGEGLRLGCF